MQLLRVREAIMQRFRPHLRARGLSDQQWRIIRVLAEAESMELLEISERCCIHAASLSLMIPKLEAAGLVSRKTNQEDQRRVIVALTPKGLRLFGTMGGESEQIYGEIRKQIGPERLRALYTQLDETLETLLAMDEPAPPSAKPRRADASARAAKSGASARPASKSPR